MTKHSKEGAGGTREGAGPPQKYGEETVNVTFRVPLSKKEEFRAYGNKKLKSWQKKKQ
jgi:hypothetical protein